MNPRCRAGDLAVVVDATHRCNLGRIVRIIEEHDRTGDLVFRDVGFVWFVESPQRMTWSIGKRRIRRKRGPVPDCYLKPIRGRPYGQSDHISQKEKNIPLERAIGLKQSNGVQSEGSYTSMYHTR